MQSLTAIRAGLELNAHRRESVITSSFILHLGKVICNARFFQKGAELRRAATTDFLARQILKEGAEINGCILGTIDMLGMDSELRGVPASGKHWKSHHTGLLAGCKA